MARSQVWSSALRHEHQVDEAAHPAVPHGAVIPLATTGCCLYNEKIVNFFFYSNNKWLKISHEIRVW